MNRPAVLKYPGAFALLAMSALACGKKNPAPLAQLGPITRAQVQRDSQDFTFPVTDSARLTALGALLRAVPAGWKGPIESPSSTELTAVLWRGDTIVGVVWIAPQLLAEQGRGVQTVFTRRISRELETQLRTLIDTGAVAGPAR
jgi:predicted small lipoprotein YifL